MILTIRALRGFPSKRGNRDVSEEAFEALNEFFMTVQRTCVDRALFTILQGQAVKALRETTMPIFDDESFKCIENRLLECKNVIRTQSIGNEVLEIIPVRHEGEETL